MGIPSKGPLPSWLVRLKLHIAPPTLFAVGWKPLRGLNPYSIACTCSFFIIPLVSHVQNSVTANTIRHRFFPSSEYTVKSKMFFFTSCHYLSVISSD